MALLLKLLRLCELLDECLNLGVSSELVSLNLLGSLLVELLELELLGLRIENGLPLWKGLGNKLLLLGSKLWLLGSKLLLLGRKLLLGSKLLLGKLLSLES